MISKVEAQDLFFQRHLPISSLSRAEPHSKRNHSLRSEKAAVLSLCPHIKYILASAGVPKGPKRQQSRQPAAPGEGSETQLDLARKGQMHLDLLSNARLVNPKVDLGGTNPEHIQQELS